MLIISALYGMYLELRPSAARVPRAVAPIVANIPIIPPPPAA